MYTVQCDKVLGNLLGKQSLITSKHKNCIPSLSLKCHNFPPASCVFYQDFVIRHHVLNICMYCTYYYYSLFSKTTSLWVTLIPNNIQAQKQITSLAHKLIIALKKLMN